MANKINLSLTRSISYSRLSRIPTMLGFLLLLTVTLSIARQGQNAGRFQDSTQSSLITSASQKMAQVPPRSEAAQEQREEKPPPTKDTIEWETSTVQPTLTIKAVSPCKLFFRGKTGKQGVINFCGEEVKYSGHIKADEAAKIFFEYLRDYMAACEIHTKEKREE